MKWLLCVCGLSFGALAQTSPLPDPWVPPQARVPRAGPAPQGEEQQERVRAKVRRVLEAAEADRADRAKRAAAAPPPASAPR